MKVLFVAGHEFIEKQDNGGRQCSYRNYTVLQTIFGAENVYLCLLSNVTATDPDRHIQVFPTHRNLAEQIRNTLFLRNGYSKKTERGIIAYIRKTKPDMLFFDFSILGGLLRHLGTDFETVLFLHNIERHYMRGRIRRGGPAYLLPYFSYSYNEKAIVRRADKIICLNSRDSSLLWEHYGRRADFLMPMTFQDRFDPARAAARSGRDASYRQLLFVGSLFPPNYDGIYWFCQNVMPHLPACRLTIIGKDMEKKRGELSAGNIEVVGTVECTDRYYYEADAVVIPILYGDGMKIKTAEAMMYGKPIFGTREALEGYETDGVSGIHKCDSADDYIAQISAWASQPSDVGYAKSVRQLFIDRYETGRLLEKAADFLTSRNG